MFVWVGREVGEEERTYIALIKLFNIKVRAIRHSNLKIFWLQDCFIQLW
jgi:hypothetical protein